MKRGTDFPSMERSSDAAPQGASELKGDVIPPEVLDLVRFMCATWSEIDRFAYQYCGGDVLLHYPVVQGTRNQLRLHKIGKQPHDLKNVAKAAEWMQRYNAKLCRERSESA